MYMGESMNVNRGRETVQHRQLKRRVSDAFLESGWYVAPEHLGADLVVFYPRSGLVMAVEIERSPRHVLVNLQRDLQRGCHLVLIIVPNERMKAKVERRTECCPESIQREIRIIAMTEFENGDLLACLQGRGTCAGSMHVSTNPAGVDDRHQHKEARL